MEETQLQYKSRLPLVPWNTTQRTQSSTMKQNTYHSNLGWHITPCVTHCRFLMILAILVLPSAPKTSLMEHMPIFPIQTSGQENSPGSTSHLSTFEWWQYWYHSFGVWFSRLLARRKWSYILLIQPSPLWTLQFVHLTCCKAISMHQEGDPTRLMGCWTDCTPGQDSRQ